MKECSKSTDAVGGEVYEDRWRIKGIGAMIKTIPKMHAGIRFDRWLMLLAPSAPGRDSWKK